MVVYDHATALRAQTYEIVHRLPKISSATPNLDAFIEQLEKLRQLSELSQKISAADYPKAFKHYLLKDAKQSIRPLQESRLNSGYLIWKTDGCTITLDYLTAVKEERKGCECWLNPGKTIQFKEGFEPFPFTIISEERF